MRRPMTLVVVLAVLTACAGESAETTVTTSPEPTIPLSTTTTTTITTASTTTSIAPTYDAADVPTLALYLAAIESGLEGTSLEGAAFAEPESLINTGVLFCSLLDEGFSPIDVLRGWVAALSAEGATPPEDDLLLGGVVLGAAVKLICPEHLDDLEL